MVTQIYGRAFKALMKQPFRLIGLSLFGTLLICLATILFGAPLGIGLAISLLFDAALAQIFLRSYRGETCNTKDMFAPFKSFDSIKRTLGGMAWRELWIFIWSLIPIAGFVFAIIRGYQYALTPYILMNEENVKAMDAIDISKQRTKGYCGKMFWADILVFLLFFGAFLVLGLLSMIPYVGALFTFVLFVLYIAFVVFYPLFIGLVHAAFYEEIMNPSIPLQQPVPQQPVQPYQQPVQPYQQPAPQAWAPPAPAVEPAFRFCTNCGTRYDTNQTRICPSCGKPAE